MFLCLDFIDKPQVLWWLPGHLKSAFLTERFPITSQISNGSKDGKGSPSRRPLHGARP